MTLKRAPFGQPEEIFSKKKPARGGLWSMVFETSVMMISAAAAGMAATAGRMR
jgi:hypothetical protein